jgi:hypothetical protein
MKVSSFTPVLWGIKIYSYPCIKILLFSIEFQFLECITVNDAKKETLIKFHGVFFIKPPALRGDIVFNYPLFKINTISLEIWFLECCFACNIR